MLLRPLLASVLIVALAACNRDDDARDLTADTSLSSMPEALDYELTSENYRKWVVANGLLDSMNIEPTERLSTRDPSDEDIDSVVTAIEADERARSAMERAAISAEDYVLTTIALAQSWDAVQGAGAVAKVPEENAAFVRSQASAGTTLSSRPRSRYVDDDRPRRGKGKAKKRGRGKRKG